VITFNQNPTTATNGSTQTICTSGTATLSGNNPSIGTGAWTVVSGPSTSSAQFASTSVFNTVFTPAGGAGSYLVRWTISNSPCTASTADATITVTTSSGGTATASLSSVCLGDSTSISLTGHSGTIQWQRSENSGTSWTSISGATSSTYTTPSLNVATSYRAVVTNGSCASANSTVAAVSISEANQSNAGNATYNTTWSNGQNDSTTGFGAWTLSATGGAGFFSSGSSDVNNANTRSWGMYAGGTGGGNVASATRTVSMGMGNKIAFSMDNGSITSGGTIGFGLQNASGQNLMELYFVGGNTFYTLNDNAGANATSLGYTTGGLDITVTYTAVNTYSVTITGKGGSTVTYTSRTFSTQGGGQLPAQIRFFNAGAGSGGSFDLFFNSLSINNPVITTQPATGTQSYCIGATPTNLTVAASGSGLSYQWFSNIAASNAGGTNLGSSSGAQTATYTPQNSTANTLYYYCVVTGGCSSTLVTSNVSGAITVKALPTPTFTVEPGATACATNDVSYTTQSGQTNYIWTVPGVLNTDYSITSGGVGTGSNTVTLKWLTTGSKTVTINYTTNGCTATSATSSTATTISAAPAPTFTAQPGATVCASTDVTYTTQSGQTNYVWTVPGVLNTDYSITSGSIGTGSNTVTLKWLTIGSKTVTINYTTSGCTAGTATSSTATTVSALPTPTFTAQPGAAACLGTDVTYTTQSGQTNYIWTVPGVLSTDYSITSGGIGTSSNTVTLKWLTSGSKTITINYTTSGCTAASATSSTATTVSATAPTAVAGPDISQCNSGAFTMAANAASPGTGTWTVVSGTAIITSANSTTSTITGVPFDTSATLRWTITNSPCSPTQDDIVVTNSSTNTWIGGTSTDWNTGANWCGGVPTSGSNVVIPSGTSFSPSIYQTANAVANSVNIANGASLSMSNAYALSITSGGSITTNSSGTFTAGDGTVNFIGSGTITGTVAFYNVNLSGLVAFSNAVTVNNRLRIATGGAVTTNSPTYGSGSLLQYFVGASYNRSLEWTSATSGAGYPANVQISTNSTNTTLNMLTTSAQCSGNLTIDSGNTLNTTSNILTVVGNVLINGTMSLGGDVYTRGNWTVGASGTQANNTKAVFFTAATGDQMVAKTGGGTVFFDYLIIDKVTSGNVVIESTTNITLNTATGQVLQLNNAGGLDLNGRALTFNNSGGAIYVNGARNIISTPSSPNGTIEINQYKVIQNNSGTGTLNLGPTVTVNLNTNGNLDFGSNITTVNGILSINSNTNCFVNTNPPIYSTTSTLIYNTGSNRNRSVEWNATSGAGYPNNMIVQNNTTLNVKNGDNSYKKIAGSLTITTGSSFVITDLTTTTPSAIDITGVGVEIVGDILNNGTITLNGTTDTRLKGFNFVNGYSNNTATTTLSGSAGGDIEVKGDFTDNAIFTVSQRAIFFTGTATQNVSGTASSPFNIDYMVVAKASGSGPVLLNKDLLVGGPLTGSVITFVSTADIIDLNGFTLTVGSSGVTNSIAGSGSFKGSGSSNLVINGVGDIGTIYFDQTTPGTTNVLNNLTVNRTSTGGGFSLGNDVNISNQLTLTNGTINLASANMTLGSSAPAISVASPSATNMIIASGTGELRKTFSTAGSYTFPIGDNVGTSEYSPATLTFSGNPSGYAGVRVQDAKHPNINSGIVDFISRYWPVSSTISSSSCTASFTYLASDENGTVANYFGGRYLNPDWYCLSDVDDTNRVISSTVGAFGDFTIYTPPAMTSALTTSAATICANTSTNLQVAIGGGDAPYTVGPYTVVYNDSVLATNITVNSYTSGANISVSPTAATTYTLVSVTSSKACSSVASDTKTVTIGGTSTYVSSAWSPSAPTATSTAVIDGLGVGDNYNVAADITACSLHVKNGAIVTIPSTFKITLSGALTVESGSSFILENDSNLVQTGGTTNPNSGSIQVNRNSSSLYLLDYTLWSSPVENQNLYSFSPRTLGNRFYVFDTPTNLYNPIASSNNFTVAKGYLIRVPKNFSSTTPAIYEGLFTGKPNSGTINFALSNQGPTIYSNPPLNTIVDVPATAAVKGFNAVGNPYPSQINVHNFIDANISNITGTLYFWRKKNDQTQPSYSTLTKLGYVANSAPGGGTSNTSNYFNTSNNAANTWVINVGQGFIVQATAATDLVFTNAMRRGVNNSNQFFRTSNKTTIDDSGYKLNLTRKDGFFSQMLVKYSSDYTLGVDRGIDGSNINSEEYMCSSIDGVAYAIQGRPEFTLTDIVPLQYKVATAAEYSISIEQFDGLFGTQDVYIKDKLTNFIHNLKTGPYTFVSEPGTFTDRFEVVYENPLSTSDTKFNQNSVLVYKQSQEVVINTGTVQMSNVKIYDIRGRLLVSKSNINASQVKMYAGSTQQVLIVKITSDTNGVVTKKVIN
ncbi:T9SS sorting signal type C domain-containing protein, partial [Flavobacterium myungsuense]